MFTHYETLGVAQTATPQQIKRCYRILVKRFHPDLFPPGSEAQACGGEKLKKINTAYAVLSNAQKRASYDAKLAKGRSPSLEPKPEYCGRCGKPTLYSQIGREVPRCNECG